MLPPDFDFHKHAVRLGSAEGVNPSGRWGNRHVKIVDAPEHLVSKHVSDFLHVAGVPHPRADFAHRGGEWIVHAPWTDGKPLDHATSDELSRVNTPVSRHTLLSEWLGEVGDRHAGNYMLDGNGVVHSIDHGLTGMSERGAYGLNAKWGALMQALRAGGMKPGDEFHPEGVKRLLANAEALQSAHALAMSGYPETHRTNHAEALRGKLAHLARLGTVRVSDIL